jgi:hypothetical protein
MALKSTKKLLLSLSVAAALGVSGTVSADAARVEELESRIAELEALVHELMKRPEPVQDTCCTNIDEKTAAIAEEKVTAILAAHEAAEAEKVHKHSYKFGGYVKLDTMYSDYSGGSVASGSIGRDFYIAGTVPVGTEGESYTDFHAKESRINFRSTHNLDNGAKMTTFVELDFLATNDGNERVSNSYSPRLRHAFFTYNKWLFGQTWMTFFNVGALPENLDFVGPAESTIFGRQAMIRYTTGNWQFAAENPETTITPYGGALIDPGDPDDPDDDKLITRRIVADDNQIPDLVARYNWKGDWGSVTVAGIYRELALNQANALNSTDDEGNPILVAVDDSTDGWGLSLSGKFMIGEKDDFRWMASTGSGMGRYMGLNTANAAVIDSGGNLKAIESTGVFGSYRHFWNNKWRSNLTLGYLTVDNDTDLTGTGVTTEASSVHINLIYSPVPKMDFGIEYMHANREVESGADGDLDRIQFSAKYAY